MPETNTISRPVRVVLLWQLVVTAVLTLLAGWMAGAHGALSAALGGAVSVCAGCSSAVVAAKGKAQSAGGILFWALRAEGVKLGVMLVMLWVAFAVYEQIVAAAFLGTFVATAVIFSMAFFVREYN